VLIPVRIAILELGLLQAFAFVGALLAIYTVYKLSRTTGLAPLTSLLLTGYAVGSLLAAGLAMAMYLSGAQLRQIFTYLLGSFDAASWTRLAWALPIVAIATVGILLRARERSTGCCSGRRPRRTSASTSLGSAASCSVSPRWPPQRPSRSAA
jgi:ABC-type Fe3+-siderophore transport system permease subunit